MPDLKISLITVVHNAEGTICRCVESVLGQDFGNIEYIVIDGASTDRTPGLLEKYRAGITHFLSEPDKGIYDAMNKGIALATGDIIGLLNADDFFADEAVLGVVARSFKEQDAGIVYGDLDYVNESGAIVRKWRSGELTRNGLRLGWMPPHPTFYCKRALFEKFGGYSLDHGTAADYELMLRFLYAGRLPAFYIKKVLVKMRTGGKSNQNLNNRLKGLFFDLRAMQQNKIPLPVIALVLKPLRKVIQYF